MTDQTQDQADAKADGKGPAEPTAAEEQAADAIGEAKGKLAKTDPDQKPPDDAPPIVLASWRVNSFAKRLLDDDARARQFAMHLMVMARKDPKISSASPESMIAAMMACVHLDLMPNTPEQLAFIIPYGNQLQFQVGYKGMQELAYRSGQVATLNAELVFDADEFDVRLGTDRWIKHNPDFTIDRTDFSKVTRVYATATLRNGAKTFEVLSLADLNKIKDVTKTKSTDTPWKKWPEVMAKKTAMKRLLKFMPASSKDKRLQYAAMFDSWGEAGRLAFQDGQVIEGKNKQVADAEKQKATDAKVKAAKAAVDGTGKGEK